MAKRKIRCRGNDVNETELTQDRVRELFCYDPSTGFFSRLVSVGSRRVGETGGNLSAIGYIIISIDNKKYYAHRLAWLYVYGIWPPHETDHINLNRADNRISNLRAATRSENSRNKLAQMNNICGVKGVSKETRSPNEITSGKRYYARIAVNGKQKYLGRYRTAEEAGEAYSKAAEKLHEEFARSS